MQGSDKLWGAIKTIIVADLVMSVDNVIAIAGAALKHGRALVPLVVLGLLISIPIIVWGSQLVIKLMDPLSPHHHLGRHAAGLDCWRHAGHRPCVREPRRDGLDAQVGSVDEKDLAVISDTLYWARTSWAPCWCWRWASSSCPAALATAAEGGAARLTRACTAAPRRSQPACRLRPEGVDLRPPHGQNNALLLLFHPVHPSTGPATWTKIICVRGRR